MQRSQKYGLSLAGALGAAALSLAPAAAADLLTPRPPPAAPVVAPAPPINWNGFYLGGFAGGSFESSSQGYSVSSTYLTANLPSLIPYVNGVGSQRLSARGADLGLQAGYEWRLANTFVLGVAGDVSWSDLNGSRTTSGILPIVQLPYSINQKLSADWLGSLRLRAGVTPLDNLLVYVTGGPALGQFTYSSSFTDTLVAPFAPGNETESVSFHAVRLGWTLGTGAEWALSRNWSLAGEYRYSQYGSVSGVGVLPLQQPPSTAYLSHSTGAIQMNSLRVGLNYHFD
jgi:outer membrane immunogenic protein